MRILHRMAKQARERKGPGLAPHIPMPDGATGTAGEIEPGLSPADLELLEMATAKVPLLGPAARSRGRHLADAERSLHGDDALRELLGHLHWMERVHGQGVFPATWGQHICAVLAACHELHTGDTTREPPPQAEDCGCRWLMPRTPGDDPAWVPCDAHADRLLGLVQDGDAR